MQPYTNTVVGVHLVVEQDGLLLLGRRAPTAAFAPDTWHLVAGHLEAGESAAACAVREADEELGVTVAERDLELIHVVHQQDPDDDQARLQLFFRVRSWTGTPRICEPDLCTALGWWPPGAGLPEPLVEYTRTALNAIGTGQMFTALGWHR